MSRTVKWVIGVALGLVGVVALTMLLFDWNWLRGSATGLASDKTGRSVEIGDIQGEWSLRPRIVLSDIRLGNVDWAEGGDMLTAETVEFVIDIPELLGGRLVLPEIRLVKPALALERQPDGTTNWDFDALDTASGAAPDDRSEMPLIGQLIIEDGTLTYRDPGTGLMLDGKLDTAQGGSGDAGESTVTLTGEGTLQGDPFKIKLVGGSLLTLRESDTPYPLTVDIEAVQSQGRISGTVQDPIRFTGLDLEVTLKGPDLSLLSQVTGIPFPMTPPYDLGAQLKYEGDVISFDNLTGEMGRSDIAGSLAVDTGRDRLFVSADLVSDRLHYRDVGSLIGIKQDPQEEAADKPAKPKASQPPRRVLPDTPLNIALVRDVDAKVLFKGRRVIAPNLPLSDVDLTLTLENGLLTLSPLSLGVAGGRTLATIAINAREQPVRTDYDVLLRNYRLERFLDAAGVKGAGEGRINGRIKLVGFGDTIRSSLGSANGDIRLAMNRGQLSNLALEIIGIDIAEAIGFWAGGDKNVAINCMLGDLMVKQGLVTPRIFVMDTDDSTVQITGGANLGKEELGLQLETYPKDPSLFSARTPITVKGTFAQPVVGIDAGQAAARAAGAVALGVLLTPLASILAFIEPGLEEDTDCAVLMQKKR
ncbi:MAG: AsmA family protein [Alphaproteobacteria bacterium]|nr:AsmA family protein [Alphaproteobacteria bacterium]MBU0889114.1 AsmA family protein [Alphaproteobacteria bacterium]MBU1812148.1 AsmA family protein [Alphaproteobacteria bacterium]MBU2091894.1 AsmA family protein [Alphaproteobacteria bacterium]